MPSRRHGLTASLQALGASARLANLPSVASNVWLGGALALTAGGRIAPGPFIGSCALLVLAASSLYLSGNLLNDWADRHWDAHHRPERALPRGLFSAHAYKSAALGLALLGCVVAAAVHPRCLVVALLIILSILFYTSAHKRSAWAVVPMAACRALLPVLGFVGLAPTCSGTTVWLPVALAACGLSCHIAGLSLEARGESEHPSPSSTRFSARSLFVVAAGFMGLTSCCALTLPALSCLAGLPPYSLWVLLCLTVFRHPISRRVSNLLAGIPMLDWIILLPLALTLGTHGRTALVVLLCLLVPVLALIAGKLLQRLAPAT